MEISKELDDLFMDLTERLYKRYEGIVKEQFKVEEPSEEQVMGYMLLEWASLAETDLMNEMAKESDMFGNELRIRMLKGLGLEIK